MLFKTKFSVFQGAKHIARVKGQANVTSLNFFMQSSRSPSVASAASAASPSPSTSSEVVAESTTVCSRLNSFVQNNADSRSELMLLFTAIKLNISARSLDSLSSLLPDICPDSDVAKKVSLGRTKFSYLLCFGVAPFLKEKLVSSIKGCSEFVIVFDESLNKISQRSQMDLLCRFWCNESNSVVTKYLTSVFLSHTTADDLLSAFCKGIQELDFGNLLAISMDGPNVNWSFLTKLVSLRKQKSLPEIVEVGSCGLHVVHGALQTGHSKAGWKLGEVFQSAYYLFKDSPKRRANYSEISDSTSFPMKFCSVRWCENVKVAKRFLDILPCLKEYVANVKPKPTVLSFSRLEVAFKDPLLTAKIGFFISVAQLLEPFLRKFQGSEPLLPFLFDDLSEIQRSLAIR